ncbi:DgyrCDS7645 [Dimorphilus gyrociliatus]|uniref:DgyrCDS7645 n=1 Tax=Dimorphilus gyrociliatus TaxID=2664684 RepID=A0A7I8VU89_9ANNE|nr:DgyrCDS7645 [Dimorphilus gyrociliatus]
MLRIVVIIFKFTYITYSLGFDGEISKKEAIAFLRDKIGTDKLTDIYDWDDYVREQNNNSDLHYYYNAGRYTPVYIKVYQELKNFPRAAYGRPSLTHDEKLKDPYGQLMHSRDFLPFYMIKVIKENSKKFDPAAKHTDKNIIHSIIQSTLNSKKIQPFQKTGELIVCHYPCMNPQACRAGSLLIPLKCIKTKVDIFEASNDWEKENPDITAICKCPDGFTYDDKVGCKSQKSCSEYVKNNICPDAINCFVGSNNETICKCPPYRQGRTCKSLRDPCDKSFKDIFNPDEPFQKCGNHKCLSDRHNPTYGYRCDCRDGFISMTLNKLGVEIGPHCSDIDECEVGVLETEACNGLGTCVNEYGSYSCYCQKGYVGRTCNLRVADEKLNNWIGWSSWSKCTKSCGVGIKKQYKLCPKNRRCSLSSQIVMREQNCNVKECPLTLGPKTGLGKKLGINMNQFKEKTVS